MSVPLLHGAGSVHSVWMAAAGGNTPSIPAPQLEYGQLSPMLIVFGAAVAGILAEAFVPRRARYTTQVGLALTGLAGAFIALIVLASQGYGSTKSGLIAMGSVAEDGPALFLQGVILLAAVVAVLLYAERGLDPRTEGGPRDAFTPQGSATPAASRSGRPPGRASPPPRSTRSPCSRSAACCSSRPPTTC